MQRIEFQEWKIHRERRKWRKRWHNAGLKKTETASNTRATALKSSIVYDAVIYAAIVLVNATLFLSIIPSFTLPLFTQTTLFFYAPKNNFFSKGRGSQPPGRVRAFLNLLIYNFKVKIFVLLKDKFKV